MELTLSLLMANLRERENPEADVVSVEICVRARIWIWRKGCEALRRVYAA